MSDLSRECRELIVGFDATERGRDALALACPLALATGARLRIVRFTDRGDSSERERLRAELRAEAAGLLRSPDLQVDAVDVEAGPPTQGLARLAEAREDQMVVIGSTHRAGLGRVYPGSVAERVLMGARCPVAVAPRGLAAAMEAFAGGEPDARLVRDELRVIAVAFDGRPESHAALSVATRLALGAKATLRVIAVSPAPLPGASERPRLEEILDQTVRGLPGELRALPVPLRGSSIGLLLDQATQGVDLLVLGSKGQGPIRRIALGSTSTDLLRSSPCPLLLVPRSGITGPRAAETEA